MATYKVPQDVEADDKLLGPFSFRQFIYLIIVAMAGFLAWALAQVFIVLAIIPIPIILLFGALALPLRKDQPMEIYLAALISFFLKPRKRLWDPEGIETLIEITAPKTVEVRRVKDLSQDEAVQRLSYLADIVDSGGWAIRGVSGASTVMNNDVYLEAQSAVDVLDTNNSVAHNFDQMMASSTQTLKDKARERMFQQAAMSASNPIQATPLQNPQDSLQNVYQAFPQAQPEAQDMPLPQVAYDPYPEIQQSVIQPLGDTHRVDNDGLPQTVSAPKPAVNNAPTSTSDTTPNADIMKLVSNSDGLSVASIAREAKRLKKKAEEKADDGEVIVSLR